MFELPRAKLLSHSLFLGENWLCVVEFGYYLRPDLALVGDNELLCTLDISTSMHSFTI